MSHLIGLYFLKSVGYLTVKIVAWQCGIIWHFLLSLAVNFRSEKRLSLWRFSAQRNRELVPRICRKFRDFLKKKSAASFAPLTVTFV